MQKYLPKDKGCIIDAYVPGGNKYGAYIKYDLSKSDLPKIFKGGDVWSPPRFTPIRGCKGVSRKNRKINFVLVHFWENPESAKEVLAVMKEHALRPAVYEELIAFGKHWGWGEHSEHNVFALGSVASPRRSPQIAFLGRSDGVLVPFHRSSRRHLLSGVYLAVRKSRAVPKRKAA